MLLIPSSARRAAQALSSRRIREAQSAPRSPIDAQGRLALGSSVMSQSIEEGVGSSIVSLARLAQERTRGREQVQRSPRGRLQAGDAAASHPSSWAAKPNSAPRHRVASAVRPAALPPRALHLGSAATPQLETHLERRLTVLHPPHRPRPDARTLPRLPSPESRQFGGPTGFLLLLSSSARVEGASCVPKGSTAGLLALPSSGRPKGRGLPVHR